MAEPKYPPYSIKTRQSGESLNFEVYKGNSNITVWAKNSKAPAIKIPINLNRRETILRLITMIKKASPDTKITMKHERFDEPNKAWKLEWMITLVKDQKMVYHIVITDCLNGGQTYDFVIRGPGGDNITMNGGETGSEADRSGDALSAMEQWLRGAIIGETLTYEPRPMNGNYKGGNGGGNRGGYSNNGGGNNRASQGSNGGDDEAYDEDMPF